MIICYRLLYNLPLRKLRLKQISAEELKPIKDKKELIRYINFLANFLNLTSAERTILLDIIEKFCLIWNKSGTKFAIQYLSECFRYVIEFLNNRGIITDKVRVAKYKNGLPKLLSPRAIQLLCRFRLELDSRDTPRILLLGKVILTVLATFRAMSPEHVIKFDSVVNPFTGDIKTLKQELLAKSLKTINGFNKPLKVKSPKFIWSPKAGVNAQYAWLSISLDLVALISNPEIWFAHLSYMLKMRYYL